MHGILIIVCNGGKHKINMQTVIIVCHCYAMSCNKSSLSVWTIEKAGGRRVGSDPTCRLLALLIVFTDRGPGTDYM